MTPEEIIAWLKDEKNAPVFHELAKSAGYESQDDVSGLKKNRDDLRTNYEKQRKLNEELQKKLADVDIDEYHTLKQKSSGQTGDEKLQRELKRLAEERDNLSKTLELVSAEHERTLKESELSKVLETNGFKQHKSLLHKAYLENVYIEKDGDRKEYYMKQGDNTIPIAEFWKKFRDTETGKLYVDKPINAGSGTQGLTSSGGNVKSMSRGEFEKLDNESRIQYTKSGGEITD